MAAGSKHVRLFLRTAAERLTDAEALYQSDRYGGAVYLGGYGAVYLGGCGAVYLGGYVAECGLKAMLLAAVPRYGEGEVLASFRGAAAHSLYRLRGRYLNSRGAQFPAEVQRDFAVLADWTVDLRYNPSHVSGADAKAFLRRAATFLRFCESRSR